MIAMALVCRPALRDRRRAHLGAGRDGARRRSWTSWSGSSAEHGMGLIIITHDPGVVGARGRLRRR